MYKAEVENFFESFFFEYPIYIYIGVRAIHFAVLGGKLPLEDLIVMTNLHKNTPSPFFMKFKYINIGGLILLILALI